MQHKIVFLDLDGTVNSSSNIRDHLIPTMPQFEENWAVWHAHHVCEKRNPAVIEVVRELKAAGWIIVILSMRGDQFTASTEEQLKSWGVPADAYILKSPRDNRTPGAFKKDEIMSYLISAYLMNQSLDVMVIDDSPEVHKAIRTIMMPRRIGSLNVLEVAKFKG